MSDESVPHREFMKTFEDSCTKGLGPSAKSKLEFVYEHTVGPVESHWSPDNARFVLMCVREAAETAESFSTGELIQEAEVEAAVRIVITHWREECRRKSVFNRGLFCSNYPL